MMSSLEVTPPAKKIKSVTETQEKLSSPQDYCVSERSHLVLNRYCYISKN